MAFSKLIMDTVADTTRFPTSGSWGQISSSIVISCEAGSVTVHDANGDILLATIAAADGVDSKKILDYYQGAQLYFTATAASTTVRLGKHQWLDM